MHIGSSRQKQVKITAHVNLSNGAKGNICALMYELRYFGFVQLDLQSSIIFLEESEDHDDHTGGGGLKSQ